MAAFSTYSSKSAEGGAKKGVALETSPCKGGLGRTLTGKGNAMKRGCKEKFTKLTRILIIEITSSISPQETGKKKGGGLQIRIIRRKPKYDWFFVQTLS